MSCWGSTTFSSTKGACGQAGDWGWVDDCPSVTTEATTTSTTTTATTASTTTTTFTTTTRHTSDYLDLSFNPALAAQREKDLEESRQDIRADEIKHS